MKRFVGLVLLIAVVASVGFGTVFTASANEYVHCGSGYHTTLSDTEYSRRTDEYHAYLDQLVKDKKITKEEARDYKEDSRFMTSFCSEYGYNHTTARQSGTHHSNHQYEQQRGTAYGSSRTTYRSGRHHTR